MAAIDFFSLREPAPVPMILGFSQLLSVDKKMSSNAIVHVSDASFAQDVLSADVPVLVDFWAAWCGPCKMIAPILDDLAEQYAGKLKIAKVDVDANKEVPGKFGIRGIPTLILFKNGEPAATKVGALSKAQLIEFINSSLA